MLVQGGTLYVGAGSVVDPQTTVVDAGATMTIDGTYSGTLGNDTFTVSGSVNGAGTIDLLAGDDVLTLNDGGDISGLTNPLDGGGHTPVGDSVMLNFASDATFSSGNVINFERLVKQNAAYRHVDRCERVQRRHGDRWRRADRHRGAGDANVRPGRRHDRQRRRHAAGRRRNRELASPAARASTP